ncbi:MAG: hypothetical protein R3F14_32355 [Polyangiaceae bacterium]
MSSKGELWVCALLGAPAPPAMRAGLVELFEEVAWMGAGRA